MMLWLNLDVIHNKNKLSHIAIWGLLLTNVMLNESLYIMFWAVTIIASIEFVNCYAWDGRNNSPPPPHFVIKYDKVIFPLKLTYHEVYF